MYLSLFHGRKFPTEQLSDWGTDGPVIGPVELSFTYGTIKVHQPDNGHFEELLGHGDLIYFDGVYYGDVDVWADNAFIPRSGAERTERKILTHAEYCAQRELDKVALEKIQQPIRERAEKEERRQNGLVSALQGTVRMLEKACRRRGVNARHKREFAEQAERIRAALIGVPHTPPTLVDGSCAQCGGPGWLIFSDNQVQKCDGCEEFAGDLEAAIAFFAAGGYAQDGTRQSLDYIRVRPLAPAIPAITTEEHLAKLSHQFESRFQTKPKSDAERI